MGMFPEKSCRITEDRNISCQMRQFKRSKTPNWEANFFASYSRANGNIPGISCILPLNGIPFARERTVTPEMVKDNDIGTKDS